MMVRGTGKWLKWAELTPVVSRLPRAERRLALDERKQLGG